MTVPLLAKLAAKSGVGSYALPAQGRVLAQASSASANYRTVLFVATPFFSDIDADGYGIMSPPYGHNDAFVIRGAYIAPDTVITGVGASGAGATASVELYRAGTLIGTIASLAFNLNTNATALDLTSLGSITAAQSKVRFSDLVTFRWLQGATGLALPASRIVLQVA